MSVDIFQIVRLNNKTEFYRNINSFDINVLNEYSQNLLHEAVAYQSIELGLELIKRGIDVNCQDMKGQTPLHYAGVHNNIVLAKAILDKCGDLNIRDVHGNNPLWTAVFNAKGNYELVELYVTGGADAEGKNNHGRSPLDFAAQIKDETLVNLLQ